MKKWIWISLPAYVVLVSLTLSAAFLNIQAIPHTDFFYYSVFARRSSFCLQHQKVLRRSANCAVSIVHHTLQEPLRNRSRSVRQNSEEFHINRYVQKSAENLLYYSWHKTTNKTLNGGIVMKKLSGVIIVLIIILILVTLCNNVNFRWAMGWL